MFKRALLALALSLFWATSAFAQTPPTCGSSNLVVNPPIFQWKQQQATSGELYETGTLVMDKADLTINGETLTTRVYAQEPTDGSEPVLSIPGPTLIMESGKKYVMSFKNLLPYEPLTHEHNTFTDPNVTNVHTHGLHISGESPGDDVTRAFEGQRGGDYVYDIPADHMAGTFWYHAHHHGSTFLQVSSGAFGLIIIEDPADPSVPQNVKDMEERHLILGYLEPGNAKGTGGDSLISGTFSSGWTINGTVNGDVCIPADTWQNWRMLVADQDARLVDLEIGANCEVALMARDGVWRTEVPKALPDGTLTLTGASRADLAVKCSENSTITVGGVQVANILVDAPPDPASDASPYASSGTTDTWMPARPPYLWDLREATNVHSETVRMGARSVLGRKFDADIPNLIQEQAGVQEYSLNGAVNHPFHLHVYHVQVQSDCGPFEGGEYYDVIAGNCDLRFDLSAQAGTYNGRTIFHCHILEHEDQGAMGWLQVDIGQEGKGPPTFPVGEGLSFSDYYPLNEDPPTGGPAAPENLTATAISSSQISLSWMDKSNDEGGFIIERLDGSDFAQIASLSPNTQSYPDDGLNASTTYTYRVGATNNDGTSTSYSDTASATTLTAGGNPTSVQVQSVVVSTVNEGKGRKSGLAVVTIVDDLGDPVDGANVFGAFSGDVNEPASSATGSDGTVSLSSSSTKPLNNLTFCVTSVTHDTLAEFTGPVCGSL
jgi:FtsP/CotA-like multicopper oxidase with cupredoxin domain